MTQLKDLFLCTRPVFFERPEEDIYTYTSRGTAFLIFYQEEYYAVTAGHLFQTFNPDHFSLLVNEKDDQFIPFNLFTRPKSPSISTSDYADVHILRVEKSLLNTVQLNSLMALNLSEFRKRSTTLNNGDQIVITGYPSQRRCVVYESRMLRYQRVSIDGNLQGPSNEEHKYRVKIHDETLVNDYDGLSGSPALKVALHNNGKYEVWFAGMVIRGDAKRRLLEFIDFVVIFNILDKLGQSN